jgi:hypothetical protein
MDYSYMSSTKVVFTVCIVYQTIYRINHLFQNGRALLKCRIFILLHWCANSLTYPDRILTKLQIKISVWLLHENISCIKLFWYLLLTVKLRDEYIL